MKPFSADDYRKFHYALVARDIRRLAAKIHRANIDDETGEMIAAALDQLGSRVWAMSFHDPATGSLIKDDNVYSDRRPVTTAIDWGEGCATLVHSPDPAHESDGAADELSEEVWPAGPDERPCHPLD